MHSLYLKKGEHRRLFRGHLWAFSNELQTVPHDIAAGETVQLFTHDKKPVGTGFYNPQSLISFRLLSRKNEIPDEAFFAARIREALTLRQKLYPSEETNAYRLIHGESDGLPGLVIDRFNEALVLQSYSAGMDRHLPLICNVLRSQFNPSCIIIRNESVLRELEGLQLYKDIVLGDQPHTVQVIHDHGIKFTADLYEGHKTGFFLDQRENRRMVRRLSEGADTLDVFTSDGGFGLNSLYAGASSLTMVDISADALGRAEENAQLNNLGNFSSLQGDAFTILEELIRQKRQYDLVILDPPSFTKSRKNLPRALQAYKKLNRLGLRLVRDGGFLCTASCSHHAAESDFLHAVHQASLPEKKHLRMIYRNSQPADHPVLLSMPETSYLKFACFYVTPL